MVELLRVRGIEVCFKTVTTDYEGLGILTDRKQALLQREAIKLSQRSLP